MADLEHIAELVDWPETPAFRVPDRRPRSLLVPAVAVAVVAAIGIAFAVPDSRGAILRFLHLGAVSVERVDTLPAAERRALVDSLGFRTTRADARNVLGEPFRERTDRLYRTGTVVSTLLPGTILLSELRTQDNPYVLKKFAGAATSARWLRIEGRQALWISGGEHVYMGPALPPRYAGNTLIWQDGAITFRLEGNALTLERAQELARGLIARG
jgi:hypothetical protein